MSFDKINFINEPKFEYKEHIGENVCCYMSSYQYDCYKDKNGEVILIISHKDNDSPGTQYFIFLISLNNNKVIKKLEGHKDEFITVRYFQNPYSKKDYLISACNNAIIWDLNDFCKIFEIQNSSDSNFFSNLLIFDLNNTYAVFSILGEGSTKVFDLKDKSKFTEINDTDKLPIYYLDYWYNKKSNQYILIQSGKKSILMHEFPNNKIYDTFNIIEKHSYNSGLLVLTSGERDLLAISSSNALIIIYDLNQKKIMLKIIFDNHVSLGNFVKWNDNYLFVFDSINDRIINFNIKNFEFKQEDEISLPNTKLNRFIKKVNHPIYGESIMCVDIYSKIKLFVNAKDK